MNYWKLLGSTVILMTALCVGIHFYAKWDIQRFEESLGEPYTPASQKIEPTANFAKKQVLPETTQPPETEMEAAFEKQQQTESQITDTAGEEASLAEFLNELGDAELAALLENPDTADADFLQEPSDNPSEMGSSLIVSEGLDATQASDWVEIEIEGDLRLGDIIDLTGLGDGDNVIIIDGTRGTRVE